MRRLFNRWRIFASLVLMVAVLEGTVRLLGFDAWVFELVALGGIVGAVVLAWNERGS